MSHIQRHSPVRNIGIATRGVTGTVPSFGKYESSLERDFMEILRFEPNIERFVPQPLTLSYYDRDGKARKYTPDGLIYFKADEAVESLPLTPVLFEVKYRADFRKDWKVLLPKFRAAKAHCMEQGWRFEVFTEREIRTPYLQNVKFLWAYLEQKPSPALTERILQTLWDLEEADPDLLLCALCRDATNRALLIPSLWYLIATGAIGCDLDTPLTMHSLIWPQQDC